MIFGGQQRERVLMFVVIYGFVSLFPMRAIDRNALCRSQNPLVYGSKCHVAEDADSLRQGGHHRNAASGFYLPILLGPALSSLQNLSHRPSR